VDEIDPHLASLREKSEFGRLVDDFESKYSALRIRKR